MKRRVVIATPALAPTAVLAHASERAVILTDRPREIHRDEANRLHAEKGPALLYRDGWGIHAWHGIRIPAVWLDGKPPSAAEASSPASSPSA